MTLARSGDESRCSHGERLAACSRSGAHQARARRARTARSIATASPAETSATDPMSRNAAVKLPSSDSIPTKPGPKCAPRTEGGGIQYGQPPARVRSHHESHHVRNDELPRGPVDTRRDAVDDDRVFHIRRAASTNVSAPRPSGPLRPKRSPNIAASRLPPPVATSATDTSKTPRTASRDRHCVSKYSGRELSEDAAAKNGTKRGTRRH